MASIPTPTSVHTCSGLVTLYALQSTELITKAAAAAAHSVVAVPASPAAATGRDPRQGPTGSLSPHQQQQQHRQLCGSVPLVLPDLLMVSSTSLVYPGLLAEAAHLLLAALLHPAAPATFPLPTLPQDINTLPGQSLVYPGQPGSWCGPSSPQQQQQEGQQVFTSPGAAAAASCWPPAVLQLAVLHAQQQQQQPDAAQQQDSSSASQATPTPAAVAAAAAGGVLSLQQLPLWLPHLVLSAAAAVAHPTRMPPELLAAVSAGLLDVLLGPAPGPSSCVAGGWLCQVVRGGGGHWAVWRPYLGKPGHLVHRWVFVCGGGEGVH
jgi:hypothetical protein